MDIKKITKQLNQLYPEKKIIVTDPKNPTEIICETEPTKEHPEWSEAIAVIDKIRPHYHKKLTETYEVFKGKLKIYLNSKKHIIKSGESITIKPMVINWAEGKTVWFKVYSKPGWTPDDHILVLEDKKVSRKEYDK